MTLHSGIGLGDQEIRPTRMLLSTLVRSEAIQRCSNGAAVVAKLRSTVGWICIASTCSLVLNCCSSAAHLRLSDGGTVRGTIVRGCWQHVVLDQDAGGPYLPVRRSEIADVDHPGNVVGVVGFVSALAGVIAMGFGRQVLGNDSENIALGPEVGRYAITIGLATSLLGASAAYWGLSDYGQSTGHFADREAVFPQSKSDDDVGPECPDLGPRPWLPTQSKAETAIQ